MVYSIYLKNGIVYLPAMVNQGTARYMEVEPVASRSRRRYYRLTPCVAGDDFQAK